MLQKVFEIFYFTDITRAGVEGNLISGTAVKISPHFGEISCYVSVTGSEGQFPKPDHTRQEKKE